MQSYSEASVGRLTPVDYNGYVEASIQGYSKGNVGPFITVNYNG
jgi:hypothetical protein